MIKKLSLFFLALFLLTASPAFAQQSQNFFEYAPDGWASNRLDENNVATPYQLFTLNQGVVLNGLDLWLDNLGGASTITIAILDDQNTTLHTQTETLPIISQVEGGTKFHVNLTSEVPINSGQQYAIQISSPSPSLGIYYADLINIVTHNQGTLASFSNGAARLGSQLQDFTFKFALYKVPGAVPPSEDPEEETPPPPVQNPTLTNAHIVSLTDTGATIAWSTNVAATSLLKIRSQLNPLFIFTEASDPTPELEHSLSVTGLYPGAFYFADLESAYGTTTLRLTLSFQTETSLPSPPSDPPPNNPPPSNPPPSDTQPSDPEDSTPPSNPPSESSSSEGSSGSSVESSAGTATPTNQGSSNNLPLVGFEEGSGGVIVSWPAGSPSSGYRLDIFDYDYNLLRQVNVPKDKNETVVKNLESGVHHAIVYENNNGEFSKAAAPTTITLKTNKGLITMILKVISIVLLSVGSIVGFFIWKFKREKTELPAEEGYTPEV